MPTPSAGPEGRAIDPTLVERFRADLAGVFGRAFDGAAMTDTARVLLAVSGGPDSMAMLALASAAMPGRVVAATVDHGLRPDAAGEARLVADSCAGLDVIHAILSPSQAIAGRSVQRRAREARYEALTAYAESQDICPIITAHHADDQAETLLMRLNRASGLAGLAAIRPYRFAGGAVVLRPFLGWRRADLRAVAVQSGLPFVDDPSNADPRHDRSRIRALLATHPELNPAGLAASASFLGDAEDMIRRQAETLWSERWVGPDRGFAIDDLPRELRRRLLRRAIRATRERHAIVLPAFGDAANVEKSLDALEAGRPAMLAGLTLIPGKDGWMFRPAPPRRA